MISLTENCALLSSLINDTLSQRGLSVMLRVQYARMRQTFRCSVCGKAGCTFQPPWRAKDDFEPFPAGREVRLGGQRLTGESYEARDRRIAAAYTYRWRFG